ncbi:rRNA-processing protein UTP23 homolog [Watersipora subatra]|uniref:rRNA-processing protein UTP23 homolog n=1 Tax=Watersipora subatra TaxID=2589382 RepID=UPI00355BD572
MKGKRFKNIQKTLRFYKINFEIESPYRLLIDGTLCNAAYANHINLAEQIPKLFQADVKIYTTKCALSEVESLQSRFGVSRGTSLTILKQFPVIPCNHLLAGDVKDCFASKYRNNTESVDKNKFCVGTQDLEIRDHARKKGGVPLFCLKSKVPHIEPPSEKSKALAYEKIEQKALPKHSKKVLIDIKKSCGVDKPSETAKRPRKRKGKNPLSCLKKKRKLTETQSVTAKCRKRQRRKKEPASDDILTLVKNAASL